MPDALRPLVVSPVLSAYAERQGLEASAFLADGSLSLIFDGAYRVQVRPQSGGRLILQSRVLDLSMVPSSQRGEVLVSVLRYAAGTVRDFAVSLVLEETQQFLLQQQVLLPTVDVRLLESELADFVNVLGYWQKVCGSTVRGPDA